MRTIKEILKYAFVTHNDSQPFFMMIDAVGLYDMTQ